MQCAWAPLALASGLFTRPGGGGTSGLWLQRCSGCSRAARGGACVIAMDPDVDGSGWIHSRLRAERLQQIRPPQQGHRPKDGLRERLSGNGDNTLATAERQRQRPLMPWACR